MKLQISKLTKTWQAAEEQGKLAEAAAGVCLPFSNGASSANGLCGAAEQVSEDSLKAAAKLGNTSAAGLISGIKAECSGNADAGESKDKVAERKFNKLKITPVLGSYTCDHIFSSGISDMRVDKCKELFPTSKICVPDEGKQKLDLSAEDVRTEMSEDQKTKVKKGCGDLTDVTLAAWTAKEDSFYENSTAENTNLTQLGAKISTACAAQSNQQSNKVVDQLGQILGGAGGTGVNAIR